MEDKSLARFLIGSNRVRFDVLSELFSEINVLEYGSVRIIVDVHTIFGKLYGEPRIMNIHEGNPETFVLDLVVGFFNVLGHYRRFMATRLERDNTIYAVFNRKPTRYHTERVSSFKEKLYARYRDPRYTFINECVDRAWNFIVELSPYFEGIYCLDNDGIDDHAVMAGLVGKDTFNVLIDRNMYASQLVSRNTVMLYPKRDSSRLLTESTCFERGILWDTKAVSDPGLVPSMIPFVWMLSGCGDVSVKRTVYSPTVGYSMRVMNAMVRDGVLMEGMPVDYFVEAAKPYLKNKHITFFCERMSMRSRHSVLDLERCASVLTDAERLRIGSGIIDLYDETALEQMNQMLADRSMDPNLFEIENLNLAEGFTYGY